MDNLDPAQSSPFPDDRPPRNVLEEALFEIGEDNQRKLDFFGTLMEHRVTVLTTREWDPHSPPPEDMQLLFVSDGDNQEQPMLAIFTHPARTARYKGQDGFDHAVEMDARQAFLGCHDGCGAFINPNWRHNMRVDPIVAQQLRQSVERWLERLKQERQPPDPTWPMDSGA